ncbi:aminoglycoside phosphotransferase family protein (plasmid) [Halorussus limi]|uniref:Aminoglycoside phosphotransferase family protein n=1 Tax=Halorussus limi TaxID=2938695 RepID=A0A8U0I0U0_9EURY|nr:aminoglycoside phosphotransferase family protein [Halorussus limi]UPV76643.1 aminoglycoside phosphotransferase family protein [Halorussus limi]
MIGSIVEYIAENHSIDRDKVSYSVYSGSGTYRYLTIRIYCDGEPMVVCRVPRWSTSAIETQYETLQTVNNIVEGSGPLETSIEKPLALKTIDGVPVIFKEFVSGTVAKGIVRKNVSEAVGFLRKAVNWLIDFLLGTQPYWVYEAEVKRERLNELGVPPETDRTETFINSHLLFLAPCHGDFVPSNILISDTDDINGVIDWELFSVRGVPMFDFMHLVVATGTHQFGATSEMIQKTFFEHNRFSATVRACATDYCSALGFAVKDFRRTLPIYSDIRLSRGHNLDNLDFLRKLREQLVNFNSDIVPLCD